MQQLNLERSAERHMQRPRQRQRRTSRPGLGLGLFSVGLGLAELLATRGVQALIGIPNTRGSRLVLRALGVRELLSGVGLLARPSSAGWLWSRVAGDAMDLALLGDGFTMRRSQRGRLMTATALVAGVTALDAWSAASRTRKFGLARVGAPIHVLKTITINCEPLAVYQFWRDLTNLPTFMAHLSSVEVTDGRSKWRAKGPAGLNISWEAEVVLDREGECIAWRSVEGSTSVPNQGVVRFSEAPGGRGTEVQVELKYAPPGGAIGKAFAMLFGEEPTQQIGGDLRRLKQVLETGEVLHSDASIHRGPHPARPAEDTEAIETQYYTGAAQ